MVLNVLILFLNIDLGTVLSAAAGLECEAFVDDAAIAEYLKRPPEQVRLAELYPELPQPIPFPEAVAYAVWDEENDREYDRTIPRNTPRATTSTSPSRKGTVPSRRISP